MALAAFGAVSCAPDDRTPEPGAWNDAGDHRWRALPVLGRRVGFTRLAASRTGIDFLNRVPEARQMENRNYAHGAGVALADVDGDGRIDLYFPRTAGAAALYRNLGNWRFEDVADVSGVELSDHASRGATFADVDGDGDADLLVSGLGEPLRLLRNHGAGRFVDATREAGFQTARGSTTLALADVDGDADLDLYVANNKTRVADDMFSPSERAFERVVRRLGDGFEVIAEMRDHYRIEVDGTVVRRFERAEPDEFYLNDGAGRFEPVSLTGGAFLDAAGEPLTAPPDEWGLTARFHDIDGDGDPDLYVANDFNSPDMLWLNDGDGRFRAAPPTALRTTSLSSMAVDFSDVDRDGDSDFITPDMLSRASRVRKTQVPSYVPEPTPPGDIDTRLQVNRNTLQLNRGDATFAEVARYAGVAASDWTWGSLFLDVDLDGWEDLLMTTGHPWDQLDADTRARLAGPGGPDWRDELGAFPPLLQHNVAFRNLGTLEFEEVGEGWGFAGDPDISHGIATGDLDLDGDLDVVVSRFDEPPAVYRNESPAPRVSVVLRGRAPNTRGIGSSIALRGGSLPVQTKELAAGGSYLSGSDPTVSFAAEPGAPHTLEVRWRSGRISRVEGVRANRHYEIREPAADRSPQAGAGGPTAATDPSFEGWFEDVSELVGFDHVEAEFDELSRQPLLPLRLAQLGPGVAWEDLDRDGDPDLLVTSGRGGRTGLYRNEGGRFVDLTASMPPALLDQTTALAVPGPGGRPEILIGQSTYEADNPDQALATASVIRLRLDGFATATGRIAVEAAGAVPPARSAIGPLALADVDADGALDLFVGGRVIPTGYPLPAESRLMIHRDGRLIPDPGAEALLGEAGLVSAALFTDVDTDGDPDLLLALDWGAIRLLRNDAGRWTDATDSWGLGDLRGRWNGLASGDFDEDGRPDLVATSWGENTEFRVGPGRPLVLVYGDFDANGFIDVVEAAHDDRLGDLAPLRGLPTLGRGLPYIRRTVASHAAYADATLSDVIGPPLARAGRHEAETLSHTLFLNRGDKFEARPLGRLAQLAPAFYAGVGDFDGDGHDDLFISQNFFATSGSTPRYDAGRSLWLRGDGRGGLAPVSASGIEVYGDPRGAALADFDRDGRLDVAVSQNGAALLLYRNVGARPGLLVRLEGPPGNPDAVGAAIRVMYEDGAGPSREVQAGSGYWSRDEAVQLFGLRAEPAAIRVRWPGGETTETPVPSGARAITIRSP